MAIACPNKAAPVTPSAILPNVSALDSIPKPVDSTDALALAICHHWRGVGDSKIQIALANEKERLRAREAKAATK